MPSGPRAEKRLANAIGATIEIEQDRDELTNAAAQLGSKGGKARAANLSPERKAEIARKAAAKRWTNQSTD